MTITRRSRCGCLGWLVGRVTSLVLAAGLLPAVAGAQNADLSVTKTGPAQVQGGGAGTITYLIVTTNNGPSTATNVVLRDTLPPTSTFTFLSASRGASRTARRLTWPAVTLTSGQTIVDTVVIQVNAAGGTVLANVAVVSASQADPNAANNLSRIQTLVVDATMIGVTVAPNGADTARRLPSNGTEYTYAFTVTNTGTVASDFDLLAGPGAGGGSFLTVDSITGAGVTRGAVPDSARLSGIAAGASGNAAVWYRVANVAAGSLDSLVLRARSVPLPAIGDPGWFFVRVVRPAILTVKSVAPSGVQAPGTDLTYTLVVTNAGSEQAASVVSVDSLPAQVDFEVGSGGAVLPGGVTVVVAYSTDGTTWTYTPVSGGCGAPAGHDRCVTRVRWTFQQPLSAVAPDNTATFEFRARIR